MNRSTVLCLLQCLLLVQGSCASGGPDNEAAQLDLDERSSTQSLDDVDELPGESLTFDVSADAMTFVSLRDAQLVDGASQDSTDWDIAFRGWDVFTNSGPSGPGRGGGFGPLDESDFLLDRVPEVPFLRPDATGGPFLGWYAYDDETHQLWSRYHVYAVRQAERYWKVQVLGYYGQQFGAPVSALYHLRYASLNAEGSSEPHEVTELDATAGYPDVDDSKPSGCLDLTSGQTRQLTPEQARESEAWHLCFRRDSISVNGEEGGPGQVSAVDLDDRTLDETLADIQERTAESEFERFDDVDRVTDDRLNYRGDRVVSIFDDEWFEGRGSDARPAPASWLVLGADGEPFYMVVFREIRGTSEASGKVTLQVRRVRE